MGKVGKIILGVVLVAAGLLLPLPAPIKGFLINAGIGMALSGVADLFTPTPKQRAAPIAANSAGGLDTLPLAFGTMRLGGKELVPATVTDNYGRHSEDLTPDGVAESYHKAIAHTLCSDNGVDSFGDVYLDGQLIAESDIDVDGWVTHADWLDDDSHPMVQIESFVGSHAQTVSTVLDAAVTGWTSNHRLRGIAYTRARFVRPQGEDSEARFQEVLKGRVPEVSRIVNGNPTYDVRLDTTRGGSGSHRADDPTTWEWSDNPALIAATYLLMREKDFGVEVDPDIIDWTTVAAAATVCDDTFATPSGDLARYRFSSVLDSPNPDDNLSHIADAMAGTITYDPTRGLWVMFAGAYDSPVDTIDESWLRGDIEYTSKTEIGALWNACKVNYVQPALDYEPTTSLLRTNSSYETEDDGQQLVRELHIPGIEHEFRAQRRAIIEVNRSREQRMLALRCNMKALALGFWDTVDVTLPDDTLDGTYRVAEYKWSEDGFPDMVLVEAISTTYDSVSGDYTARTFPAAPGRTSEVPPKPVISDLTVTVEGVLIEIEPIGRHAYSHFEIQRAAVSNFSVVDKTIKTPDATYIDSIPTVKTIRYYRVRAVGANGQVSAWSDSDSIVPDAAALGADVTADSTDVYVTNPGFEAGDTGWTKSGGATIEADAVNAKRGSYVGKIVATGKFTNDIHFECSEGDRILARAWLKGGTAGAGRAAIEWLNAAGSAISQSNGNSIAHSSATYLRSRVIDVAPALTVDARLIVETITSPAGSWYVDQTKAREVLARAGEVIENEDGDLLSDKDIRNDKQVESGLAAINKNPTFEIPRRGADDVLRPAGWFQWNDITPGMAYLDDTTRDVITIGDECVISSAAFAVDPRLHYEFVALVRAESGTVTVQLSGHELDTDLSTGKRAIGLSTNAESQIEVRTRSTGALVSDTGVTTTYKVIRGRYRPTGTAKWASMAIYTPSTAGCRAEWGVVRVMGASEFAQLPQGSYDNLIVNPGAELASTNPHDTAINAGGGTWSVSTTFARSGAYSFHYDYTGQTGNADMDLNGVAASGLGAHIACADGDQFYMEAYARRGPGGAATGRIRTEYYDETCAQLAANGVAVALGTSFARIEHITTAPAGSAYVVPGIRINSGASSNAYFDDIYFRRVMQPEAVAAVVSAGVAATFSAQPITNSTDVGATATINLAATTLNVGGRSASYGSGTVSGLAFGTKYYIYRDDANLDGSGSYVATTNLQDVTAAPGRIFLGTHMTVADGGGTGGSNSNIPACVAADQFLGPVLQAVHARPGVALDCLMDDLVSGYHRARIEDLDVGVVPCVELLTESGIRLVCSETTPLTLKNGSIINVLDGLDREVPVLDFGELRWERLVSIQPAGIRQVAHIHCGGRTYFAGSEPQRMIGSHNGFKP